MTTHDFTTADGIIAALYGAISFPKGGSADIDSLRQVFIPEGRLLIPKRDQPAAQSMGVEQFIARCKTVFAGDRFRGKGFRETEINRQGFRYGNIMHILSVYEAAMTDDAETIIGRGINSIQLHWENGRWWIVSMVWDDERPDNPLPDWARTTR